MKNMGENKKQFNSFPKSEDREKVNEKRRINRVQAKLDNLFL